MKRFRGLGPKQEEVFRQIAFGHDGTGCPRATLRALEAKGLIVGADVPTYGPTMAPMDRIPIMVRRYTVTLPLHMEYCRWCSEQPDDEVPA